MSSSLVLAEFFFQMLLSQTTPWDKKRPQTRTFILPLFFPLFRLLVCCQILMVKSLTGKSLVRSSFVWDLRNQVRLHLPKSPPVFCKPLSSNSISTSSFIIYACTPPSSDSLSFSLSFSLDCGSVEHYLIVVAFLFHVFSHFSEDERRGRHWTCG